ncbi:MAG: hypothetical protein ACM36B_13890 [Bacteroidota bacterium]
MATRKRRIRKKPVWERGYLSHGLWLGRDRVGVVQLNRDAASPESRYRWEAGTYTGRTATLKEAKRAVEQAVLLGTVQLPLFDPPQRD